MGSGGGTRWAGVSGRCLMEVQGGQGHRAGSDKGQ